LLGDRKTGLSAASGFRLTGYHPRLSLDYIAQPYLVAGADRLGTFLGGGTALFFSDMLGEHNLAALAQVSGGLRDFGGLVGYTNLTHRWNWGLAAEQIPYLTGAYSMGIGAVEGEPVEVDQVLRSRQTDRAFLGVFSYPFSRVQRIELQGGFRRISFRNELETSAFSLIDGSLLLDQRQQLPAPAAINLAETSAALVHDNSVFGATSPILGSCYVVEVAPALGSIAFCSVLAEYRRYFMPVRPYTVAGRIFHIGRYGRDAEDQRLLPLYLGYPGMVRGYDFNSFRANECHPEPGSDCPALDRLFGSKMLVGNLELRFPLVGALRRPRGRDWYGPVPLELGLFTDAGVAWHRGNSPSFFGGDRRPVSSGGIALRANAFGYAIVELDFVRPLSRPEVEWVWQFNLLSGF
jgi:hypothetical protein